MNFSGSRDVVKDKELSRFRKKTWNIKYTSPIENHETNQSSVPPKNRSRILVQ
jgi:hypothetical protein